MHFSLGLSLSVKLGVMVLNIKIIIFDFYNMISSVKKYIFNSLFMFDFMWFIHMKHISLIYYTDISSIHNMVHSAYKQTTIVS